MAFSGLPSKACANCRQRRIKCNLAEPECAQCRRASKKCPGYRDQLALLFRDENEKVIRKAQGRPPSIETHKTKSGKKQLQDLEIHRFKLASSRTVVSTSEYTPSELQLWLRTSSPSISASLSLTACMQDPGIIFFFRHYMTSPPLSPSGQPDIFSSNIWKGVSQVEHFIDAVSCVGLAGLANVKGDLELMTVARQKYGITLQRVVAALKAPGRANVGYTIKTTMLLGLFEMIDCNLPTTKWWGVHLDGLAALLISKDFWETQFGMETPKKYQFFYVMFIKHLEMDQKVPYLLAKWARTLGQSLRDTDSPMASLAKMFMRFVDLNADVKPGVAINANSVLREALDLDHALKEWKVTLPPTWKYKVIMCPQTLGIYDGQYHLYSNRWVAQTWAYYRCMRVLVHEIVLIQLSSLPSASSEMQKSKSLKTIFHVASQICTSVSNQLYNLNNDSPGTSPSQLSIIFSLMWPLRVAGSATGVSESLREWVLSTLGNIEKTLGIRRARLATYPTIVQLERNGAQASQA